MHCEAGAQSNIIQLKSKGRVRIACGARSLRQAECLRRLRLDSYKESIRPSVLILLLSSKVLPRFSERLCSHLPGSHL